MKYYYLLAGLPELSTDSPCPMRTEELDGLLDETLDKDDAEALALLRMTDDAEPVQAMMEDYKENMLRRPDWWDDAVTILSENDLRTQVRYELGQQSGNSLVRNWFRFNQDMNNVLTATVCRKHGFDVSKAIVGHNEVADILRKNLPQKDFGLSGVMDNLNDVMALAETDNLLEREKKTDAVRLSWLEEATRFDWFGVGQVLAYYLQVRIMNRWEPLTVEQGEKVFREMVAEMKKGIQIESDN